MLAPVGNAKNKNPKADPKDEIEVVGHVPVTGGPINHFVATQHYSSYYLYAEHASGQTVTLIDVTKASQPAVLADVAYAPGGGYTTIDARPSWQSGPGVNMQAVPLPPAVPLRHTARGAAPRPYPARLVPGRLHRAARPLPAVPLPPAPPARPA